MVGLVANIVAAPWVTLVVTPLAMLGVFFAPIWGLVAWAVDALSWCLQQFTVLPFAVLSIAPAPLWAGLAAVLGGCAGVAVAVEPAFARGALNVVDAALAGAAAPVGEFDLLAADIGQGNAVIVLRRIMRWCRTPGRGFHWKVTRATGCWCPCCARSARWWLRSC